MVAAAFGLTAADCGGDCADRGGALRAVAGVLCADGAAFALLAYGIVRGQAHSPAVQAAMLAALIAAVGALAVSCLLLSRWLLTALVAEARLLPVVGPRRCAWCRTVLQV